MAASRTPRTRSALTASVLAAVTLLVVGSRIPGLRSVRAAARDVVAPVQRVAGSALAPVGRLFDRRSSSALRTENARLRADLAKAREAQTRYVDAVRERDELLRLGSLANPDDIPTVDARVTSDPVGNEDRTLHIDRGSAAGVAVGMPVTGDGALIGRIESVTSSTARVLLITDPRSGVGVRLSRSGDVGLARGRGPGEDLQVERIETETGVAKDEVLVTSGLRGLRYPIDIPVARVTSARRVPGGLQQDIAVEPIADLAHLTFVRVLRWRSPA